MQIIQSIREKGAAIIIIVIAISLIGFILMDAKPGGGNGSLFGGNTTNVGKINGKAIELKEFNRRVSIEENNQAAQTGQQPTGAALLRIREQVWNQIVAEEVFYKEAEKVGINLSSKELYAILMSSDPLNPFMKERGMIDPATGKLDETKAREALNNIKKFKGEQRSSVDAQILEPLKLSTAAAKYGGLISAAAYYPTWMQEKDLAEAKSFATISYVTVGYNEISDSAVIIKDEDINNYVAKHKDLFKQEAGRTISYLTFSQLPTAADTAKALQLITELKAPFAGDSNPKAFVARNTSAVDFVDEYLPLSKIQSQVKDTVVKQQIGSVAGPYLDGANYILAKVIGTKQLPDSVKARHILISLNDQTGNPIRTDSAAKKLADSILAAIKTGADFSALALKYSSDGSATKGGDLGTFGYGAMVAEFNNFTFNKSVGEKEVVRTQFGYHVIDIISQSNFKPAYKIAFLAKPILSSDETINAASLASSKAAAQKNAKALTDYAAKNGLSLVEFPTTIKENDFSVGNMQDARSLVRWTFDAKNGDVSEPIIIGDDFIVATVNKIYSEGTMDAAAARFGAEAIVRNIKKADLITAKLGVSPTLESAAAAYNKQVLTAGADSTITMTGRIINGIGAEPKIIGAAFNKEYTTKASAPIVGATGVFVIKVQGVQQLAEQMAVNKTAQATARFAAIRQQTNNWFEALRKQADIKDTRAKFF